MNRTLSPQRKDEIKQLLLNENFSLEAETRKLVEKGYEEDEAKRFVVAELQQFKREFKKEMVGKIVKREEREEIKKGVSFGVFMLSMIGPLFNITSSVWYMFVIVGAGVAGFWGFKPKPVAGLLGCIIYPVVFPFAYNTYFSGRASYIRIEMAIPMIMAAVPALLIYFIISKTVYANIKNN
jgi:hypothetical protein